jgi:hypothetical protein
MNDETKSMDSIRLVRAAKNQTLFREVNERIKDLNERPAWQLDKGDWICECEDETCFERIQIAVPEYEGLRAHGNRFALKPGHENLDVEDVTDRHEQYVVVGKRGAGGVYATETDPRANAARER